MEHRWSVMITDLEKAEQTLWCVERAATEQVPCRPDCPVPCDLPHHANPTEELVQFWQERVAKMKSIDGSASIGLGEACPWCGKTVD